MSLDIEAKLLISAGEAKAGVRRNVDVMRIVRCTACLESSDAGCAACTDGLTTREQRYSVKVPAGITTGTRLRLSGKGHESAQSPTGNLYLEVCVAGEKAEKPERTSGARDEAKPKVPGASAPSTVLLSDAELRKQRRAKVVGLAVVAAVAVMGIGAFAYDHYSRAALGASCARDSECRSGQCLGLYAEPEAIPISPAVAPDMKPIRVGFPRRTGGICSDSCKGDQDCPPTMRCLPASRSSHMAGMPDFGPGEANTFACVN
jgi:hypothetical protein